MGSGSGQGIPAHRGTPLGCPKNIHTHMHMHTHVHALKKHTYHPLHTHSFLSFTRKESFQKKQRKKWNWDNQPFPTMTAFMKYLQKSDSPTTRNSFLSFCSAAVIRH